MTEITVKVNKCDASRSRRLPPVTYESLLGPAWSRLPAAVRCRFASHDDIHGAGTRIYAGEVLATELSLAGVCLAHLARIVGAPMPFTGGATGATVVAVTNVPAFAPDHIDAQVWTRSYARPGTFPQVIQSAKCFAGATGLEERLGFGLVMRLTTSAEGETGAAELVFTSAGYRWRLGPFEIPLPAMLSPGHCEVRHRDEGAGYFTFTLTITHPVFGRLLRQVARYHDQPAPTAGGETP